MRQYAVAGASVTLVLIGTFFVGCGSNNAAVPASIVLNPPSMSLTHGTTAQITPEAFDSQSVGIATPTLAYHSDNPSVATVSSNGMVCAGQWDVNFAVCTPGTDGRANITATATTGNTVITSSTAVVYVHQRIDSVQVVPIGGPFDFSAPNLCVSQGATAQYTAVAMSNGTVVPAATVGSVTWQIVPAVATLDTINHLATDPATLTANAPGRGTVTASIGVLGSQAITGNAFFTTCPVSRIHIHVQSPTGTDTDTSFSRDKGNSLTLLADVFDSKGAALPSTLALTWTSSLPSIVSVSSGQVGTLSPGTASITASCTPPSCNGNLTQITGLPFVVYSDDVVTGKVNGAATSTVYAVSSTPPPSTTSSNAVATIDTANNNPGTPFTLPANLKINSMVLTPTGNTGYLGTDQGLLPFIGTASTFGTPVSSVTGKVLASDGVRVVVSDSTTNQTFITMAGTTVEAVLPIVATSAAFARDSSKIYLAAGGELFDYTPGLPARSVTMNLNPAGSGQQVAFFATGAMAFGVGSGVVDTVPTCTDISQSVAVSGAPTHIAAIPNGTGMVEANSPSVDEIDTTADGRCPPGITAPTVSSHDFGVGAFTARQIIVTPDSSLLIILTSDKGVLVYNLGTKATKQIALSAGTPLSGDVTPDSANLYVGATDGKVHRIDLKALADAQAIPLQSLCAVGTTAACNPDFVAVNPAQTLATLTKITVSPANSTIKVGQTQTFTATGSFSDGTSRDITSFVTWTSSNVNVAAFITVSTPNQVTGVNAGTANITATATNVSGSTTVSGATNLTVQ